MGLGINNNIPGLNANRNLNKANQRFGGALQKLSSGIRINQAKDGPADLIISELLRSQTSGIERALRNSQESYNVLSIAEGSLNEVSSQLINMREKALHALNSGITSRDQIAADQAEVSSNVGTIGRIADTTSYANQNLINGEQGIVYGKQDADGIVDTGATRLQEVPDIRNFEVDIQFSADPANQAEKAVLETDFGGGTTFATDQRFVVSGADGAREFTFAAGTDIQDAVDAINNVTDSTGVTAYATDGGTEMRLTSNEYGSGQEIQVQQVEGDAFAAAGQTAVDAGQDATVSVNGQEMQTNGLTLDLAAQGMSGTIVFNEGEVGATTIAQVGYDQDTVTDLSAATDNRNATLNDIEGGMRMQLGEGAGNQNRSIFALDSFSPSNLGRLTEGGVNYAVSSLMAGAAAALGTDPAKALEVIDQAISDVATARANIGAFQANTLQTNINSLSVALENTVATESYIRDTDMGREMSNYVRDQILMRAGIMGVQSANTNKSNVLKLLGG